LRAVALPTPPKLPGYEGRVSAQERRPGEGKVPAFTLAAGLE